jgi:hypothetical protein
MPIEVERRLRRSEPGSRPAALTTATDLGLNVARYIAAALNGLFDDVFALQLWRKWPTGGGRPKSWMPTFVGMTRRASRVGLFQPVTSSYRSRQSVLAFSISRTFQARGHVLMCFSRSMASVICGWASA